MKDVAKERDGVVHTVRHRERPRASASLSGTLTELSCQRLSSPLLTQRIFCRLHSADIAARGRVLPICPGLSAALLLGDAAPLRCLLGPTAYRWTRVIQGISLQLATRQKSGEFLCFGLGDADLGCQHDYVWNQLKPTGVTWEGFSCLDLLGSENTLQLGGTFSWPHKGPQRKMLLPFA